MKGGALHKRQHSQLEKLTGCVWGELHSRTRYGFAASCDSCGIEREPFSWAADAIRWLAGHLHCRTFISFWKDERPATVAGPVSIRHERQRQTIKATLADGPKRSRELATATGVSDSTAGDRLRELERAKVIERAYRGGLGRGNATVWQLVGKG